MSNSVQPHRRQPTRLPRPWDSPCKNTGVGCHFLLQCVKMKSESEVAQSCPTLSNPMDCSLPGSSIHGIFQATVLEWGAFSKTSYSECNVRQHHQTKYSFQYFQLEGEQRLGQLEKLKYFILVQFLEKAMATHSSTLAWKIPWTEEPGRLQSMGSRRVGHN